MPTAVSVKWQKEVFPAVEIDTEQPPYVFKCQLYDLTGVPPERQKIMIKGGLLKDDGDWSKLGVKQGQKLMMMGTADEIPKAPEKGPMFVEDLPEEEQNVASLRKLSEPVLSEKTDITLNDLLGYTAGLVNYGNTCYMNATIQCLHSVPELNASLQKYSLGIGSESDPSSHSLTLATRDVFGDLDRSHRPVAPDRFLKVLRTKYPQFAQMSQGMYMQQDAEECWTQLLYTLSLRLRVDPENRSSAGVVKQLFGIDLTSVVKCAESGEESSEAESVYTVKCHISHDVNHLHEGLKQGLKSELEKTSPVLGRSALYVKESFISQLPPYLTVQFVRFFWKRESGQKAKILRKVDYPLVLDVFDLCTEELKIKLSGPREALRKSEDEKAGLKVKEPLAEEKSAIGMKEDREKKASKDHDTEMVDSTPLSNPLGQGNSTGTPSSSGHADKSTQLTGIYDLVAVLTHKGRSADSGHYVAWVKQENGKWIEFDDENPIPQREEDITKLSGGGDWHMAYICMYKARVAPTAS